MNSGQSQRVSVVIVSYHTKDFLRGCLASLYKDASHLVTEIIVVDNHSEDGSVSMVETEFPEVTLLKNSCNLGYAKAVNQGIRQSSGRYILILNPDIEVSPDAIGRLWSFMERTTNAGLAGAKLLNPDGSLQMSCRTFYTLPVVLLRRTFLGKVFPNSKMVRDHLMLEWDHNSDREVDWVTGACMMVRREAYEIVGGMDERFFLYFEDVDWCYRMKKHGWKVYYVHSSIMKHHYRRESARLLPDRKLVSHLLSSFRFYDKWSSAMYALKRERRVLSFLATLALDIIFINLSFVLAYYLRHLISPLLVKPLYPIVSYRGFMIFVNIVCLFSFVYSGLYHRTGRTGFVRDLVRVSRALLLSSLVIMAATYLTRTIAYSRVVVLVFWPISAFLVTAGRSLQRHLHRRLWRSLFDLRRVGIVGEDDTAAGLRRRLLSAASSGFDLVGFIVPAGRQGGPELRPVLATTDEIARAVTEHKLHEVLVCDRQLSREDIGKIVIAARNCGAEVKVVSEVTDMLIRGSQLEDLGGIPVVVFPPASLAGTRLVTKYLCDYFFATLSLVGLLVLSPLVLLVQTLTFRNYQPWVRGLGGSWRVLKGERSLVGPRLPVGGERIRPGITGLWLTAGAGAEEIQKDRLDMYYIQNWSLSGDLEIMLLSLGGVAGLFGAAGRGQTNGGPDKEGDK